MVLTPLPCHFFYVTTQESVIRRIRVHPTMQNNTYRYSVSSPDDTRLIRCRQNCLLSLCTTWKERRLCVAWLQTVVRPPVSGLLVSLLKSSVCVTSRLSDLRKSCSVTIRSSTPVGSPVSYYRTGYKRSYSEYIPCYFGMCAAKDERQADVRSQVV